MHFIAKSWQWMRDVGAVLRPCRFSVLVVAAGLGLLFTPQGKELTVGLASARWWPVIAFHLSVFLWAFQSWYWARVTLDFAFGADRGARLDHPRSAKIQVYITRAPRWIAIATYAIAIYACLGYWVSMLLLAVAAVAFYYILVKRQDWANKWLGGSHYLLQRKGPLPVLSWVVVALTLIAYVGLFFWTAVDPVGFGWSFGAAAVAFIGFSMIAAIGSMLVLLTREGGTKRLQKAADEEAVAAGKAATAARDRTPLGISPGYPVVRTLVVVAVIWSLIPALDNHQVRTLAEAPRPGKALTQAFDEWYKQAPAGPDGRKNFVVVSAAGGGLRAAYWAATVLGRVQDRTPDFRKQLFAVSGVSGGSLGALVFVTLLGQDSPPHLKCIAGSGPRAPYECAGQTVLSQDFLAPTVAALLFPDLMQRFVPLGFPDRAKALEQSWERSWAVAGFKNDPWGARGFRTLWDGKPLPALLLNGTHVQTGKRIITSNLRLGADEFLNVYDFYDFPGFAKAKSMEIRPSTAAHNSARFTYVSPASTLADGTHLVDGGYFENFGAVTARELIDFAVYYFGRKKIDIRPVAIVVSNDPELRPEDFPANPAQATPPPVRKFPWASEVLSPLRAMLHTRDGRGLLAAADLRSTVEYYYAGRYFQFRLCKADEKRADPALGWVLSDESEDYMRRQLDGACGNDGQLKQLLDLLSAGKPPAQ